MIKFRHPIRVMLGLLFTLSVLLTGVLIILPKQYQKTMKDQKNDIYKEEIEKPAEPQSNTIAENKKTPRETGMSLEIESFGLSKMENYQKFVNPTLLNYLKSNNKEFGCSPSYSNTGSQLEAKYQPRDQAYDIDETVVLGNKDIPELIKSENKKLTDTQANRQIDEFKVCTASDSSTQFIMYLLSLGGGGGGRDAFFASIKDVETPSVIKVEIGAAYSGCDEMFSLTKADELYIFCGGGDGGFSTESLFKVDFQKNSSELIKKCDYIYSGDNGESNSGEIKENCT